jgi:hypothetical protein
MEPVLFVMAILGCGESAAPCRELAVVNAGYRSEAACLAATADQLARRDELYPSIVAQCRPANARPQLLRGDQVLLPEPEANRFFPRPRLASRSSR